MEGGQPIDVLSNYLRIITTSGLLEITNKRNISGEDPVLLMPSQLAGVRY